MATRTYTTIWGFTFPITICVTASSVVLERGQDDRAVGGASDVHGAVHRQPALAELEDDAGGDGEGGVGGHSDPVAVPPVVVTRIPVIPYATILGPPPAETHKHITTVIVRVRAAIPIVRTPVVAEIKAVLRPYHTMHQPVMPIPENVFMSVTITMTIPRAPPYARPVFIDDLPGAASDLADHYPG